MKKIDRFVIDTNVLISAFILPNSNARKALDKAREIGYVVLSDETSAELTEIIVRPKFDKYIPLQIRLEIVDDFLALAYLINPKISIKACRDPKDDKFLELAITANASSIITGDQDLLVLNPFEGLIIQPVNDFLIEA